MAHEKPPLDEPDTDPVPADRPAAPLSAPPFMKGDHVTGNSATKKSPGNEEPDSALEPDLPTDGRDEEGEQMIRQLPPRPELSKPPPDAGSRS